MNTEARRFSIRLLLTGVLLCEAVLAHSRGRIVRISDAAREAPEILLGEVQDVDENGFGVSNTKLIKGSSSGNQRVVWVGVENIEVRRPRLKNGDSVLIFAVKQGAQLAPYMGPTSVRQIKKNEEGDYSKAVVGMIAYSVATSSKGKAAELSKMLDDGPIARRAALETIYIENAAVPLDTLMPKIISLAKSGDRNLAVPALQIIGARGGKAEVPLLIEKMDGEDSAVAETAYGAIKTLTGKDFQVDARGEPAARKEQVKKWRDWWKDNEKHLKP